MNDSRFTTPVFGEDGVQVGTIPLGQMEPPPLPIYRDEAAEQHRMNQQWDQFQQRTNPTLFNAHQAVKRARATVAHYAEIVSNLQHQVAMLGPASPDSPVGVNHERQQTVRELRAQIEEAQSEHSAACEELETAQAAVTAELAKVKL